MKKFDIKVGDKYGRWTVLSFYSKNNRKYYKLLCDCGNEGRSESSALVHGNSKSCGCLQKEGTWRQKHGMVHSKTYKTWEMMIQRCTNQNYDGYTDYGYRDISVCQEWTDSFTNFLDDMGERPEGMTLDRIDVNGNYHKENCRWSDNSTQLYNRRTLNSNSSGKTGVSKVKNKNIWRAYINFNSKRFELGKFETFEQAVKAREEAEMKYYGYLKDKRISETIDVETTS